MRSFPQIKKSFSNYFIATILLQLLFFFRDLLIARGIGLSEDLDDWVLIFSGATFVISLFLGSTIGYLVPEMQKHTLSQKFPFEALKVLRKKIFKVISFVMIPFVFLQVSVLDVVNSENLFFLLISIILIYISVTANFQRAIFQSLQCTNYVVYSPLISITVTVLFLIIGHVKLGLFSLVIGLLVGLLLESIYLTVKVRKVAALYAPTNEPFEKLESFWSLVFAGGTTAAILVIDQYMISAMFVDGNSAFSFGGKLSSAVIGFFGGAISVIIFPKLSKQYAEYKSIKITALLVGTFFLTTLISVILFFTARPILEFLFLGGKFSSENLDLVTSIHKIIVWQIPFYITGTLGLQLLQIKGLGREVFRIALSGLFVKVILNYYLGEKYDVIGFAFSTVGFYGFTFAFIGYKIFSNDAKTSISL